MIEKRLVQWYAADAGVDLDVAEREIVLASDAYGRHVQLYEQLASALHRRGV
jgi:hypothetical protein